MTSFLSNFRGASTAFGSFGNGTPISDLVTRTKTGGQPIKVVTREEACQLRSGPGGKGCNDTGEPQQRGSSQPSFTDERHENSREDFGCGKQYCLFSFHNATQDGQPNSYAADIIDKILVGNGTEAERNAFWKALGEELRSSTSFGAAIGDSKIGHVRLLRIANLQR